MKDNFYGPTTATKMNSFGNFKHAVLKTWLMHTSIKDFLGRGL
jgi:hypothetical protein